MTARLSHTEEFALYKRDRFAWCRYIAPIWRERLKDADDETKRAWWAVASQMLRNELIRLAEIDKGKTK